MWPVPNDRYTSQPKGSTIKPFEFSIRLKLTSSQLCFSAERVRAQFDRSSSVEIVSTSANALHFTGV